MPPIAALRVLDLACGHGRLSRDLASAGANVVGVDVSGVLLDKGTGQRVRWRRIRPSRCHPSPQLVGRTPLRRLHLRIGPDGHRRSLGSSVHGSDRVAPRRLVRGVHGAPLFSWRRQGFEQLAGRRRLRRRGLVDLAEPQSQRSSYPGRGDAPQAVHIPERSARCWLGDRTPRRTGSAYPHVPLVAVPAPLTPSITLFQQLDFWLTSGNIAPPDSEEPECRSSVAPLRPAGSPSFSTAEISDSFRSGMLRCGSVLGGRCEPEPGPPRQPTRSEWFSLGGQMSS